MADFQCLSGLSQGTYNVQMSDGSRTNCVLILDPALVINEPAVLSASRYGYKCFMFQCK